MKLGGDDIFGISYPWLEDMQLLDDGSLLIMVTQERDDGSANEFFLLPAFSDIWDLWRNLENLHFAFKRYKMNVYGKKISEFMKELANVKRRIFNYRCAS